MKLLPAIKSCFLNNPVQAESGTANQSRKMKENKYDEERFFKKYSQMPRSQKGLEAASEWHVLEKMMPDCCGKRVLDLGCGYGWHCRYAIEHGAISCTGIDLSEKMLHMAHKKNGSLWTNYRRIAIEDFEFEPDSFDVVISSLAFHYLESFDDICQKVWRCLTPGGHFVFSVEHPVFTAHGSQEWIVNDNGRPSHWPVDRYFTEGKRKASFLGSKVTKFHKTLTTYVNGLIRAGFTITGLVEPQPDETTLETVPGMKNELRRPMMLIVSAVK